MDRLSHRKFKKVVVLLGILVAAPAIAGTLLLPPSTVRPDEDANEGYPESRFGQGPSRAHAQPSKFERQLAAEEEELSYSRSGSDRSPAALRESGGPKRSVVPSPQMEAAMIKKRGVQEVSVIASDLGYFPKTLFVTRDIPVRLFVTGSSKNTLCIMMDSFQVRKQVKAQKIEEITFTPNVPGTYRFYCPVNGMEGTLVVKELASNVIE